MFEIVSVLLIQLIDVFPFLLGLYFLFDIVGDMILGRRR